MNLSHSVILKISCCAFPKHPVSHPGHFQLSQLIRGEGHFSNTLDVGSDPLIPGTLV